MTSTRSSTRPRHPRRPPPDPPSTAPRKKLRDELERVKEDALASGLTLEEFNSCLNTAAERSKIKLRPRGSGKKRDGQRSCCSRVTFCLKVVWIGMMLVLAFALFTAAYKPLTFYVHKIMHEKIYYVTRPLRLALVTSLPYLQALGLDFFITSDCILENPLLNDTQRCPCLSVKQPLELTLNGSSLPSDILRQDPLREFYVLRNAMEIPSDFTLGKIVGFPEEYMTTPSVCWQITSENSKGLEMYSQLFDKNLMKKLLRSKDPWAFTWQECPDRRNPSTLRVLFPPPTYTPPHTHTSITAMFILTTQWAPSAHTQDLFPSGNLIALHVVGGEVRIVPHPQESSCFDVCSGLKEHPILKAGDVFIFDQRLWSYQAYTWSRTALTYSVTIELENDTENDSDSDTQT